MSNRIEFVRNYNDLSTDKGFQFEFCCDRCGTGYRTRFKASVTGTISNAIDAAGGLFGGILGRASSLSDRVHSAAWEKAHDGAFVEAVNELKPDFIQCPRCSAWVCRKSCWNTKRGLCKDCAPDLGVEMSAAQASRSVEEVWAHAKMSAEDKKLSESNWRETVRASCPECEAPLATNAKFCPECGAKLKTASNCPGCGFEIKSKAKFCPECGEKL
ncbi:MAG: zinc ribbon domain-containing protein [Desulfotomaculaceae bacterium]|nr:zinc ribbon domain-containing protein [Desulfotomaculaceae bacterium]MDD4766101.1 zinc ribbon domain-containing protein [Desulfotomaculaceae bacterium]